MRQQTIGILYPGEMGASIGKLLAEAGVPVVTTTAGRSSRTVHLCDEAGLHTAPSVMELLDRSDVVISLVSPKAALPLAATVAEHLAGAVRPIIYIDANSVSPMTIDQVRRVFRNTNVDVEDAAIFGLASQLRQRGTVYVSGSRATETASIFKHVCGVKVVGESPGQASALKMIVSGIPKGIAALFVETLCFAGRLDLLQQSMEACDELYPSVMEIVRRMLPTYPQHALRRCEELGEVEHTMAMTGSARRILRAALEVTRDLAELDWPGSTNTEYWTTERLIKRLQAEAAMAQHEVSEAAAI